MTASSDRRGVADRESDGATEAAASTDSPPRPPYWIWFLSPQVGMILWLKYRRGRRHQRSGNEVRTQAARDSGDAHDAGDGYVSRQSLDGPATVGDDNVAAMAAARAVVQRLEEQAMAVQAVAAVNQPPLQQYNCMPTAEGMPSVPQPPKALLDDDYGQPTCVQDAIDLSISSAYERPSPQRHICTSIPEPQLDQMVQDASTEAHTTGLDDSHAVPSTSRDHLATPNIVSTDVGGDGVSTRSHNVKPIGNSHSYALSSASPSPMPFCFTTGLVAPPNSIAGSAYSAPPPPLLAALLSPSTVEASDTTGIEEQLPSA